CTPPHTLHPAIQKRIEHACRQMALALDVRGLMNAQMAVRHGEVYVLEVNPRASRTVPYVSKATGVALAKVAARIFVGQRLKDIGLPRHGEPLKWFAVKEAVLPFGRFWGTDPILGPEMKSTGEVMGIGMTFEEAYWKSQLAAGQRLPERGLVFLSVADSDKNWVAEVGWELADLGFELVATPGTAEVLRQAGLEKVHVVSKISDARGPTVLDLMAKGEVGLLINTPSSIRSRPDEVRIRSEAILRNIPMITTGAGAKATVRALRYMREHDWNVCALQDYYAIS
ncbi:MAG: ATP-grasp domain-containing protein, partial [Verrucomicrobiae bacterium]|nr:ATP-grasp domain-containing protein [Verrucomicrobiae bacterium]